MGIRSADEPVEPSVVEKEQWQMILEWIVAKRTHEPAFRELFDKILEDKGHHYHRQARTLTMLYDFTPMRPVEK